MLEVGVVLIIVGIFIAGVIASNSLVTKFRIAAAKNVTKASPMFAIKDNALWLETSLDNSFNDIESSDKSPLTTWYEQRNSVNRVFLQSVSGGPTYSNTINRIHAVKFSSSGGYFTFDGSFLNGTDYTVFVLEKRESGDSGNYFFGDSAALGVNQNLLLGYSDSEHVVHSQGGSSSYPSNVRSYLESSESVRIFTFTHSATEGKKTYINGVLAAEDASNTAHLSNLSTVSLGKGYSGQIGELAIFTRALEPNEIVSVEDYMSQKWRVNINRAKFPSCIGGVVTDSGCDSSGGTSGGSSATCDVSVDGVTSTTPVNSGTGYLTCDGTNFNGNTISYTCSGGVLTTGSNCACADDHVLSEGECVAIIPACTGGTISTSSGYKIHKFTSSGTFTCPTARNVEVLVVAGGGGGSGGTNSAGGSGGGGGGLIYRDSFSVSTSPISVTVGAGGTGGAANSNTNGGNGGNSIFSSLTAIGGGAGGGREMIGSAGGSGGGGGISGGSRAGGSGTSGQGFAGGNNSASSPNYGGGGGGGAASAGQAGTSTKGGNGGNGLEYNISGAAIYYSGGGAASYYQSSGTNGSAGLGGSAVGAAGAANTGAGGGGASASGVVGNAGGSGVVIVKYLSGPATSCDVAITGISTPSTVSVGASGALTCNASGYGGSVSYSCGSDGILTTSGSCSPPCPVSVTGVSTPTSVNSGASGNLLCNADGYNGTSTVAYNCPASGVLSVTGSCPAPIVSNVVLTSGSSYTVQSGFTQAKVWAIGAGGGGGGAGGAGGGGGSGGVVYKTWSGLNSGDVISYSLGSGGNGGSGSGATGATGGSTTVTYKGVTITASGGSGGRGDSSTVSTGGSFSGGDGGASGAGSPAVSGDTGGSSGAAIGSVSGVSNGANGGNGVNSSDVGGLFTTLSAVGGYPTTSGGSAGGSGNNGGQTNHGFAATGFGCGGGGAGWWGGNGGNGLYGGGGGGAAGEGSARTGGKGGNGVVVIKFF